MSRPTLEAVLLDAGGTLVRLDFEWMASAVRDLHSVDDPPRGPANTAITAEVLRRAEIAGRRAYDRSRGHAPKPGEPSPPLGLAGDTVTYFRVTLESAGVPATRIDTVLDRFRTRHQETGLWSPPMEGAREAVRALGELGLRCAVVSNSDGRAERCLIDAGVRDGLEFVVDSQIVGVEKPDPEIFTIALERMRLPAERVLFVGDILCVDAAGAQAAGLHFVLLDPYGDYAPMDVSAIPGIADLPAWVAENFTIVPAPPHGGVLNPDAAESRTRAVGGDTQNTPRSHFGESS